MIVPILFKAFAPWPFDRTNEPVTVGVPFAKGAVREPQGWCVEDMGGRACAAQATVLERWNDGSIRWALLDVLASLPANQTSASAALELGPRSPDVRGQLSVTREGQAVRVRTGAIECVVGPDAPLGLREVLGPHGPAVAPGGAELRATSGEGEPYAIRWARFETELEGPVRTVVSLHGQATAPKGGTLDLVATYDFFSGSPVVRLRLTVRNPRPAQHPGGIWELGDAASLFLKECTIAIAPAVAPARTRWCVDRADRTGRRAAASAGLRIYQESSGGEMWAGHNHRNRQGQVPMTFRGYRVSVDGRSETGLRASPSVVLEGDDLSVGAAVPYFWENFPRAVGAADGRLEISFWPAEFPDLHELQGGEQKTHEVFLSFGPDTVTETPLEWCHDRLIGHLEPAWYAAAGAAPALMPAAEAGAQVYRQLTDAAVEGPDTFACKRERIDEYGWRHFGDIYGDHEAVRSRDGEPLVSHYNNQYDPIAGAAFQFWLTGDIRWWRMGTELSAHVVDIDIYHTAGDKSAYNQGLFWHTVHYVDAGLAGHRSYPRGTVGGGPSSEQNYTTGLMLRYFATGDTACRDAAIGLARFVVDSDDGRRTIYRWLDRGDTGVASASGVLAYQGPGRGPGNSLNALVDGHRLTGDREFLAKAEQLIRRCVHPAEDIAALDLLDAERRWFYTMFLQSLGRYLDHKIEIDQLDDMYRYGQSALLHYARWMRTHEIPYLEKPERLEFPTETWAAQDMRKSEVFNCAVRHAQGEERHAFAERARFFYDYSTRTLLGMPTRTLARPVVLLMSFGYSRTYFDRHPGDAAPHLEAWTGSDDRPAFVPQRTRATRRAVRVAAALAAVTVVLGAMWTLSMLSLV